MEKADLICFSFDANTVDVVPLMELGLWAVSEKVIICCDYKYRRAGNVHLVCERYQIPCVEKFEDLFAAIKKALIKEDPELDEPVILYDENSLSLEPDHR